MSFCVNCGKEVSEYTNFCPNCGAKINVGGSDLSVDKDVPDAVSGGEKDLNEPFNSRGIVYFFAYRKTLKEDF